MTKVSYKTNQSVVKDIMNSSKYGALSQLFVIHALQFMCQETTKLTPEQLDQPLINGASWRGVAVEIQEKLAKIGT